MGLHPWGAGQNFWLSRARRERTFRRTFGAPAAICRRPACVTLEMTAGLFLLCGTTASTSCERPPVLNPRSLNWFSPNALSGPFAPPPAFAPLDLLSGSTAERAASVDAIESAKASLGGLAAATNSVRTGLSTGLGSDVVPLQHGRHLAQISVRTVAAFEFICAGSGDTNPLALPSPGPYAESADCMEARPHKPHTSPPLLRHTAGP